VLTLAAPPIDAGFTGALDTTRVHTTGDVKLALAAFAQRSLVDFDLSEAFGTPRVVNVDIAGISPSPSSALLPSSISLALSDDPITGALVANDGETTGDATAMGVEIALADLAPLFAGNISLPKLVRNASAFLARADHALVYNAPSSTSFDDVTIAPSTLPASSVSIHADALPAGATDVIAAAFVKKSDSGFLLFGVADAFDDDADGRVQDFTLDFAPPHDGLEGSAVTIALVAVDVDALTADAPYAGPLSARFVSFRDAAALADGIDATSLLAPPSSTFDGASFASSDAVARVDLSGPAGAWHVYGASAFDVADLTADASGFDRAATARAAAFTASRALLTSSAPLDDVVSALASDQAH
jgi:hypothetical protein